MHHTQCVLVTLTISNWDANRQDKRVSAAVADANGVQDKRLCRLRKSLLPKTTVMDRLFAVIRAARTFHYDNTHAWMHDGPRILPRSNFDPYMKQMRAFQADFETAVLDFIAQYNDIKAEAHTVLGQLYDVTDYPDKSYLRARYNFEMAVQPMPASASLLELGLEPAEAEAIRMKLEADMTETFQKANRRLWDDLYERLEKLYTRLSDEKAYVMEETLEGVRKLAELLPRMNVTNDERLNVMAAKLSSSLTGVSAEALKTNPSVRSDATAAAHSVYHGMQAFLHPDARSGLVRVAVS